MKWSVVSHILSSSALLFTHDQLGFSRTFQDLFASCVKDGQCSIIEDLLYVTEILCLSRVLAVPNTLPSLFQPEFWQFLLFQISARFRSLRDGVQPSPVSGDLWTLDSYTSNPWIVSLASAPYSLRIEFQKLVSTMVRNSSSSTSSLGPIVVPGVHRWTGDLLFAGSRPGVPLSSSLTFSSSLSLPFQHNSRFPLFGQQLTAAMWTVLSVFVEGAWSLLIARVWGVFRASLVPAVLVEKTRQSHWMKSEEVRNVVRQRCCLTTLKASSPWSRQLDIGGRFLLARNKAWRG